MANVANAGQIAIDAGQTAIKIRITHGSGVVREQLLPGLHTHVAVLPQLASAVEHAATSLEVTPAVIAVGASGLTSAEADAGALSRLLPFPADVILAHDSVTSSLGALGGRSGAVVAAGTGVVTLAVGSSAVARVDGWGHIMGDAGSGYWIGREALDAVMRAYDGRGEPTALAGAVRSRWPDLESAYIQLQAAADRVAIVAGFALTVARLAGTDAVAAAISDRAGHELARSVAAALTRAGFEEGSSVPVAALGGVFRSARVAAAFAARLADVRPGVVLQAPAGEGVDGAELLATLDESHPLWTQVSNSRLVTKIAD